MTRKTEFAIEVAAIESESNRKEIHSINKGPSEGYEITRKKTKKFMNFEFNL